MRLATLVFVLTLAAPALHAQSCTPDPAAGSYYPLNAGDEWVYHAPAFSSTPEMYVQRRVLRTEAATGQVIEQTCTVSIPDGTRTCAPERAAEIPSGLDAPLGSSPFGNCATDLGTSVTIGGTTYEVPRVKALPSIDFGPPPFASGIGPVGIQLGDFSEVTDRFEYARIGGVEYGVRPNVGAQADSNAPESYYPLAVGNQWESRFGEEMGPGLLYRRRRTIVRDTTISGVRWFVKRDQTFDLSQSGTLTQDTEALLRFDPDLANVIERSVGGPDRALFPCRLDVPLTGATDGRCGQNQTYSKRANTATIAGDRTALSFDRVFGRDRYAAGLGFYASAFEQSVDEVYYARIDGQTFGQPDATLGHIPDLTPARDYYPLQLGNEWIYSESTVLFDGYERRRIVREETIGGLTYSVEALDSYDLRSATPAWSPAVERLVRFDPASTNVVARSGGTESVLYCNLGADFDAPTSCNGTAQDGYIDLGMGPVLIGGVAYPVDRLKGIRTLADPPPPPFAAGIGPLEQSGFMGVGTYRFEYARVRGQQYGARPVAGESDAPSAEALQMRASPNPTAGALSLSLMLIEAQTVRVEAFDALGRRVFSTEAPLGAGAQSIAVDTAAWAPGVYVVRASAGAEARTVRVVRR